MSKQIKIICSDSSVKSYEISHINLRKLHNICHSFYELGDEYSNLDVLYKQYSDLLKILNESSADKVKELIVETCGSDRILENGFFQSYKKNVEEAFPSIKEIENIQRDRDDFFSFWINKLKTKRGEVTYMKIYDKVCNIINNFNEIITSDIEEIAEILNREKSKKKEDQNYESTFDIIRCEKIIHLLDELKQYTTIVNYRYLLNTFRFNHINLIEKSFLCNEMYRVYNSIYRGKTTHKNELNPWFEVILSGHEYRFKDKFKYLSDLPKITDLEKGRIDTEIHLYIKKIMCYFLFGILGEYTIYINHDRNVIHTVSIPYTGDKYYLYALLMFIENNQTVANMLIKDISFMEIDTMIGNQIKKNTVVHITSKFKSVIPAIDNIYNYKYGGKNSYFISNLYYDKYKYDEIKTDVEPENYCVDVFKWYYDNYLKIDVLYKYFDTIMYMIKTFGMYNKIDPHTIEDKIPNVNSRGVNRSEISLNIKENITNKMYEVIKPKQIHIINKNNPNIVFESTEKVQDGNLKYSIVKKNIVPNVIIDL